MMINDELPEDELDPCCQKERENERRKFAVSKELRKTDRSNVRNDLRKTVFTMDGNGKCGCCSKPSIDYALLAQLKQKLEKRNSNSSAINQEVTERRNNEDDDDDDEDGTFAELLNTLTPADEERLQQIELSVMRQEKAIANGFAVHIEDSIGHMETMIAQRRSIVCHLYDPTSSISAIIDYALEILSKKYLGTTFRRIKLSANVLPFRSKWRMEDHGNCWQPCLAVFTDGQLTASTTKMDLFCNRYNNMQEIVVSPTIDGEDDVLECIRLCVSELEKYLNHARVLEVDLPYNACGTGFRLFGGVDVDGSDEEEEEHTSYCDMEGCDRNFPHEHVTGQGGGTLTGAASNDKGADALAKDWYSKI